MCSGNIICAYKLSLKFYYKSRNPLSPLSHSAETFPLNFLADSSIHILNNMLKLLLQNFSLLCIFKLTSTMEKGCYSLLYTTTHMYYIDYTSLNFLKIKNVKKQESEYSRRLSLRKSGQRERPQCFCQQPQLGSCWQHQMLNMWVNETSDDSIHLLGYLWVFPAEVADVAEKKQSFLWYPVQFTDL